jgi:hypothetical protein
MSENKAMKTAFTYPLSLSAPNKLFARLVSCLIKLFYNTDIQYITPPQKQGLWWFGRANGMGCLLLP